MLSTFIIRDLLFLSCKYVFYDLYILRSDYLYNTTYYDPFIFLQSILSTYGKNQTLFRSPVFSRLLLLNHNFLYSCSI